MGNLLRLLAVNQYDDSKDIFLDFESKQFYSFLCFNHANGNQ